MKWFYGCSNQEDIGLFMLYDKDVDVILEINWIGGMICCII